MNTSYLKNKADHYEIYCVKTRTLNAEMTNGEMDFAVNGDIGSLAVTVVKDHKLGFAYTDNPNDLKKTADKALSLAKTNDKDKHLSGFAKPQKISRIKNFDERLLGYSTQDLLKFKSSFIKGLKSVNKGIMLSNASYHKTISNTRVINSEGTDLEETSAFNTFSYDLILKKKGELLATYGTKEGVKPLNPASSLEEARRLTSLAGKKQAETITCQAVFHPEVLSSIISTTLMPNINAENMQKGQSMFVNKLNKKVTSEELTLIDDGITKGLVATNSFDCEGTPSQKTTVIDRGVLKTALHNNYTARKEGRKSTSNAARTPYTIPSVGANNMVILPGKDRDLLNIKKGVYVREVLGTHTMNHLTGDFSLGLLEGFYIENGKIRYPIKNAMIAGNFYKMLNQITGIGNEIVHASGAAYFPEIRFAEIKLVGKS